MDHFLGVFLDAKDEPEMRRCVLEDVDVVVSRMYSDVSQMPPRVRDGEETVQEIREVAAEE